MNIEFTKQRIADKISTGDEIILFTEQDDCTPSGRYQVALLQEDDVGTLAVTLIGLGHVEGTITTIEFGPADE